MLVRFHAITEQCCVFDWKHRNIMNMPADYGAISQVCNPVKLPSLRGVTMKVFVCRIHFG